SKASALSFVSRLWISRMSLASAGSHPGIQPRDTPPSEAAAAMSGYEVSTASSGSHPANLARRMKAIGDHVLVRARPHFQTRRHWAEYSTSGLFHFHLAGEHLAVRRQ